MGTILEQITEASKALAETKIIAARRNALIKEAYEAGVPWNDIAEAAGMSRQAAYDALQRTKRG